MVRFVFISVALLSLVSCAPTQRLAKTNDLPPLCGCNLLMAPTYLVFFDWNKSILRPLSKQIIAQAASKSRSYHPVSIFVSGFTDSSGSAAYNQLLSIRRAKAVADQLVADGIPRSEIRVRGYGAGHQAEPSGPNVRLQNNRRVEIVLQ